jgi:three-Cys-motif partner protein
MNHISNSSIISEPVEHYFGGNWTADKLLRLQKYLQAYATIMAKQNFSYAYIDAFAGTGYISKKATDEPENALFRDLGGKESQSFLSGSTKIALEIDPPFTKYLFIELNREHANELQIMRNGYPKIASRVEIVVAEANVFLKDLCENRNWQNHRAVLFLDPYGMQVEWPTIESIAGTKAIDMWLLFPLGMSINRLLKKDGDIPASWIEKLNRIFGTNDWMNMFYKQQTTVTLFGKETGLAKTCNFEIISKYFVDRLRTVFPYVAQNPLTLCNSKNVPLYLLCFAAGNDRGSSIAKKIAEYILGK